MDAIGVSRHPCSAEAPEEQSQVIAVHKVVAVKKSVLAGWIFLGRIGARQTALKLSEIFQINVAVVV